MKTLRCKIAISALAVAASHVASGSVVYSTTGINFDSPYNYSNMYPVDYNGDGRDSVELDSYQGSLFFWSGGSENTLFDLDGGISMMANPIRFLLENNAAEEGSFEIWRGGDATPGTTALPLLKVASASHSAAFRGVDVSIDSDGTNGGTLKVGGKSVVVQGGNTTAFGTATSTGTNSFASGTGTSATGGSSTAIGYGTSALGADSFAGGNGAVAHSVGTFAFGGTSTSATGFYSVALGLGAVASANDSTALGYGSSATGQFSVAIGSGSISSGNGSVAAAGGNAGGTSNFAAAGAIAQGVHSLVGGEGIADYSFSSAILGSYNDYSISYANYAGSSYGSTWVNTDVAFSVGNGQSNTSRSNAQVTLKSGQTTLINKYWLDGVHALDPVTTTGAADGEALVVNGNTRLRGKVVLEQAQGDISQGIYTP